ncbi:(2Fe-2S)-binding protein [uncultured Paludibaculum sp.]|uniref:(2Fe-2S)-binding protein n=1 Tax=uncultured Paludibaculum sp. TaxID=1765020 RepID=UPI002AAB15F9|nr:(2Fe-2S)-binding protein [uncultured Paludibaculum sp.]
MPAGLVLHVNGTEHRVPSSPQTPLLYVLRNDLNLTGPRFGCGVAQCGACAVLVDGREVRSCVTPAGSVAGKRVTTIEGLGAIRAHERGLSGAEAAGTLHPVQQAWIDEQVPQCGYCQSGMMIAAADLLAKNADPSVAQIKDAFTNAPPSPHLCRCGTYSAIIDAVRRAAKVMSEGKGR